MKLKLVFGLHNGRGVDAENNGLGSFNRSSIGDRLHAAREMAF